MGRRKKKSKRAGDQPQPEHSAEELIGLESLQTPPEQRPGLLGRLVRLPFRIIALPIKLVLWVVKLPFRLVGRIFRRGSGGDQGSTP